MKIEKNLKNYVSNVSSSGRNTRWKEVYPVRRTGFAFRGWIRIRIARGEPYNLLIKYLADGWKRDLREEGGSIRREFQFPGDLWLPRRENRCRQPANNHTSYHYHTPGVYTNARHRILRSLSLLEGPRGERDWRVDARPNTFLRPAHPPVYLIINRLRLWPGEGENRARSRPSR